MIIGSLDRRAALIGLTSAIAGAALGPFFFRVTTEPLRAQPPGVQYVEPTWWDGEKSYYRKFMVSMDRVFWQIESQSPPPATPPAANVPFNAAATLVLGTMTQPGQEEMKLILATFLADSQRWQYVPYIVQALNTANSPSRSTRLGITGSLHKFHHDFGSLPFSTAVGQSLLTAFTTEPDLVVKGRISALLTLLNIPH